MSPRYSKVIVTGAAGFIGSQLCDAILSEHLSSELVGVDNLRTGALKNLGETMLTGMDLHELDLAKADLPNELFAEAEVVFHLAANPDVRIGKSDPSIDFTNNVLATHNLLEVLRRSAFGGTLVFTSTSTIYGEPTVIPTPETYGPLIPISSYGASKLACEALIMGHAKLFGFNAKLIRLANVVGGRSNHGVIRDFVQKLHADPSHLDILGDGTQNKSYLHISDCISALLLSVGVGDPVDAFNVGSSQNIDVLTIARVVIDEMNLSGVTVKTNANRTQDGRGWPGDVKTMLLDCKKIANLGWDCRYSSAEAVELATREILSVPSWKDTKI